MAIKKYRQEQSRSDRLIRWLEGRIEAVTLQELIRRWSGLYNFPHDKPEFVRYAAEGYLYWRERALTAEAALMEDACLKKKTDCIF